MVHLASSELKGQLSEEVIEKIALPVDPRAGPDNWRHLTPPRPWDVYSADHPHSGSCSKGIALRECGVVETMWMVYMTEPS